MLARVQHGVMLDGRADDMLSGVDKAENCQVVAFGAAAGKHDFRGAASQQSRHRLARALHRRPRLLSVMMDGRRVAKMLPEVSLHGLKDLGQDGGGGVIVEINAMHKLSILRFMCEAGHGAIEGCRVAQGK